MAGRKGLIHYSSTSGRWKVFADEEQEQNFSVRGGLLWFHHVLVAAVEVAKSYQVNIPYIFISNHAKHHHNISGSTILSRHGFVQSQHFTPRSSTRSCGHTVNCRQLVARVYGRQQSTPLPRRSDSRFNKTAPLRQHHLLWHHTFPKLGEDAQLDDT